MFNFSFLKCYQKKIVFCVFIFMITTNFSLSQANAVTYNSYKNKIYTNLGYMNIDSNIDILLYGIGAETKLHNSTEILCNYKTGNIKLKKDVVVKELWFDPQLKKLEPIFVGIEKQKSTDKSHIVNLTAKYDYNDFLFQADFNYMYLANTVKVYSIIEQNNAGHLHVGKVDATLNMNKNSTDFAITLGKKFAINNNLYLFPKCGIHFNKIKIEQTIKLYSATANKTHEETFLGSNTNRVNITPELVIGGDLFLPTAIKINPEISFSFLFDTSDSSNNKLHINPKINMEINQFYVAIEANSITESDGRTFLIKLGILF